MRRMLLLLRNLRVVVETAGAVLAAAVVAVETYQSLKKKISSSGPFLTSRPHLPVRCRPQIRRGTTQAADHAFAT